MNTTNTPEESTTTQPAKLLYTAKAHTTGGREGGASRTSDGRLDVKLLFWFSGNDLFGVMA